MLYFFNMPREKVPPHSSKCKSNRRAPSRMPSLALLHLFVFAFDGVVAAPSTALFRSALSAFEVRSGRTSGRALPVDLFTDLVEGLLQSFARLFDARYIVGREG